MGRKNKTQYSPTLISKTLKVSLDTYKANTKKEYINIPSLAKQDFIKLAKQDFMKVKHVKKHDQNKNKSYSIKYDGWFSDEIKISKDHENLYQIGTKMFAFLPQKYATEIYISAAKKGIVTQDGHNGIKFCQKKLIELKINDDSRLYTTVIHKNTKGESLIIFDNEGRHKTVERKCIESKGIEDITDCYDTFEVYCDGVSPNVYDASYFF